MDIVVGGDVDWHLGTVFPFGASICAVQFPVLLPVSLPTVVSCSVFEVCKSTDTPWWFRSEFSTKKTYNNYALSLSLQDIAMMSLAKEFLI